MQPATPADVPVFRYLSLGNTEDIGASCHHLEIGGTGIVLDVGMDPEADGAEAVPPLDLIQGKPVDHVIVTHAHHDHLGSLPVLVTRHPHTRVHMTEATQMISDVLLPSSARLQRRRLREGSATAPPAYDVETAEGLAYLIEAHRYDRAFDLEAPGTEPHVRLEATLYDAGHVLGSAGVLIEADDLSAGTSRTLFYTSDTQLQNQAILPGADLPEGPVDVMLLESTLGADADAEHVTRKSQEKAFGEAIAKVLARGGTVLVPTFALGRAQEVLAMIDRFKRRSIVPKDVPVYTAGQMRAMADIYDKTRTTTPRLNPEFEVFGVEQERLPRSDQRLFQLLQKPGIHVVSSGMLFERTLSNVIARQLAGDAKHGIFFVGYSKEGSPGDALIQAAARMEAEGLDEVEVKLAEDADPQPLRAEVGRFRFSGHSHRRELLSLVDRLKPRKVVLVHGETAAKTWMADNIRYFHPDIEVIVPALGEAIDL